MPSSMGSASPSRRSFADRIQHAWHHGGLVATLLRPIGGIYAQATRLRRTAYRRRWLAQRKLAVPVVVVGNISVGGTGKSPIVRALVQELARRGYQPGIVARGYGGQSKTWPRLVTAQSDPIEVGDEPVEHAMISGAQHVVVAPARVEACEYLIGLGDCDVIVADDGLQHLALARDMDIVVIDTERAPHSARCLPAGPLREPVSALGEFDHAILNGSATVDYESTYGIRTSAVDWFIGSFRAADGSGKTLEPSDFNDSGSIAVSGIGNPGRFESMLDGLGISLAERRRFPNHHRFTAEDLRTMGGEAILMTLKDAVKCRRWLRQTPGLAARCWYLERRARLAPELIESVVTKIGPPGAARVSQ